MSGARRLLLAGGIALAVWGMGYGLWYAVFAEHQALEQIGASLALGLAGPRNGTQRSPKGLFINTGKQNTSTTGKWMRTATGSALQWF